MREYETMFVIQPEISEEGSTAILAKLDGELEKHGSSRLLYEDWGKRKLAYEIDKFQKGHYRILRYLDDGQVIKPLERHLRLEESVLRFLTVLVDEDVADVDARKALANEEEAEQAKRAAERAERDAEEARQREEAERLRAEREAAEALEAAAAAEATAAAQATAAAEAAAATAESAGAEASAAEASETSKDEATTAPASDEASDAPPADAGDAAGTAEEPKEDA